MNRSYVESLVKKYQKIFRLEDWDIFLRFPKAPLTTKFAESNVNQLSRKVTMTFFNNPSKEANLEEVIRHEFAHILNAGVYAFILQMRSAGVINEENFKTFEFWNEQYCNGFERMRCLEEIYKIKAPSNDEA